MLIITTRTQVIFSIIPREFTDTLTITIRDDSTNISSTYNLVPRISPADGVVIDKNTLIIYNTFSPVLVENHFYDLEVFSDVGKTNSIYKDRIFCTDQDITQLNGGQYNLNEGQYTTYDGYNNTYTVR